MRYPILMTLKTAPNQIWSSKGVIFREEEASKLACTEYLACLFLLLADDKRCKTLKKTLNNNFLLGRQEYPKDVLASKRLMTDFDPDVATGTKRT